MKGIKEALYSYKYLTHECLALGFKNTELSIYFPTVRNIIRLLVYAISLMFGMG